MNFRKMLAILIYYHHNFRILHWKAKDCDFEVYHKLMADYYDKLQEYVDDMAEKAISNDEAPLTLQLATTMLVEDDVEYWSADPEKDYESEDLLKATAVMFKDILAAIKKLLAYDKVEGNPGIKSDLEAMYAYFDKELNYKNKRRK